LRRILVSKLRQRYGYLGPENSDDMI